jgi:hypothetical protein
MPRWCLSPNSWIDCWRRWPDALGILWCKSQRGAEGLGWVCRGEVRPCEARPDKGCDGSKEGLRAFPAAFIGGQALAGRGPARRASARHGRVWQGMARVTDGGTEAPASLPPSQGWTGHGRVGHGKVWFTSAPQGQFWQGLQTAARSFYGGSLLLSLEGRCGTLGRGWAMLGQAWRGRDWRGKARAASGGKARRGNPPFPVLPSLESGSRQAADTDQ